MYANSLNPEQIKRPVNLTQALKTFIAIAWVYLSVGAILGFFQGLLPILKAQGASLIDLRWIFVIYLPFGLCFIWAGLVDRQKRLWPGWHRGWIFIMHGVAAAACVVLAMTAISKLSMLMLAGLVLCASLATADLAMDAYCVKYLAAGHRLRAATAKLAGLGLGQLFGGAFLIANFARLGWRTCLFLLALLMLSGATTAFLLPAKADSTAKLPDDRNKSGLFNALKDAGLRALLWRVICLSCSLLALFSFNRIFLADLQIAVTTIAWVIGGIVPLVNTLVCLGMPALAKRVKLNTIMHSASVITLFATILMLVAYYQQNAMLGLIAAVINCAAATVVYAGLASMILSWAEPQRAATDYSLLYSLGRLIAMINLLILPGLILKIGWLNYFSICLLVFGCAYLSLCKLSDATMNSAKS